MTGTQDILFDIKAGIGFATLNRPQALNALNLEMTVALSERLAEWSVNNGVRAVVIQGAGDRAFCSGGDVKSVALDVKAGGDLGRKFFREEYILNNRIFTFPKPYISLIDGIVMGGGKGLSAHGSHRIVTEKIMFAMPETSIGFFPDVGGGYFLPRCPGQTGLYLALTSKRIGAADALYIGFATHYVPSDKIPELIEALCAEQDAQSAIDKFAATPEEEPELAAVRQKIDLCFGHDRIEDIIAALEKDGSPWALETLKAMGGMSPTSLKIALRQIREGAKMNFQEVMTMEYRLSQHTIQGHDFYEGIRAALIDKDRQPKWNPARVEGVSGQAVDAAFKSLGQQDLVL